MTTRHSLPVLALVCGLPPPHHGMTVYYDALFRSRFVDAFTIHHIDTSDRRNLDNVGALDFRNIILALKNLFELGRVCVKHKPDIVYVPNAQNTLGFLRDGLLIMIASLTCRARIVMHFHGGDSFQEFRAKSGFLMQRFIAFTLQRVDRAIVLGNRLQYLFSNEIPDVKVVPNGIEVKKLRPREYQDSRTCVRISFLGTLVESKGVLDLLKAAVVLRHNEDFHFELRLAGDWWAQEPETKIKAKGLVEEYGLSGMVRFIGRVSGDQKEEFLHTTDIFVLPTKNDGFPLVILEAMAAGCPVISSRGVGAIEEVVENRQTGLLIEPGLPAEILSAIVEMGDDATILSRMGEAGRQRFERLYTFEKCAQRLSSALLAGRFECEPCETGAA